MATGAATSGQTAVLQRELVLAQARTDPADAPVGAKTDSGLSALHYAAAQGHTDVMGLLLGKGAKLNGLSNYGWTPK